MKNKLDSSQIRTPVTDKLIGYRAAKRGQKGIALIKVSDNKAVECMGFICTTDLVAMLNTGPYIEID
jgi:hypothetical protein